MFSKENDERICYFKMEKLNTKNIVRFRLKYFPLQNFSTVIQLLIMGSPSEVYFILFMTVNSSMCLAINVEKTLVEKHAEKPQ